MTSEQFTYWLQGFIEMNPNAMITHTQWEMLKQHLATVFKKVTPELGKPFPVAPVIGPSPVVPGIPPRFVDTMPKIDPQIGWPYQITC